MAPNDDDGVNDYARYLMVLDGEHRSDAVATARHYPSSSYAKAVEPRDVGSYARYLMVVDGMRYEQAMAEASVRDGRQGPLVLAAH